MASSRPSFCQFNDRHTDLIGEFESAGAFPIFFGDKYLDQRTQMGALGIVQHAVVDNVTADDALPLSRKRSLSQLLPTMIGQPVKYRNFRSIRPPSMKCQG
jgi:hypothetical protein